MKLEIKGAAEKWKELGRRYQYALLVVILGVFLMLLPSGRSEERTVPPTGEGTGVPFELKEFERRLEEMLSQIEGAGTVRVLLTLDSGSRRMLAQNLDREQDGSGTTTVVTVNQGSGRQDVVELQTFSPKFRGALVVCTGGRNPTVQLHMTEAVTALTGLRADQVSVCQGNGT